MRVVTGFLAAGFTLALTLTPAAAAPFDGKWLADVPAQGRCTYTATMNMMVLDGDIQGQIHNPANVVNFTGKVDADGNGNILVNRAAQGTIKFDGDRFQADWPNSACSRHAEGDRAIDEARQAVLVTERKRHQDAYADLIKRANAGEKINYGALRAESVYAESWDFYDTKLGTLLDQANVAAKGKDCTAALQKTDQIFRIDFTIDAAHAIAADCLEDSDRARSKSESAIADGLIHSLIDSGDGDSEAGAYVVSTQREENDALANRHIQFRARQTAIRGSNGHYYDIVQGLELHGCRTTGAVTQCTSSVAPTPKTVYFDVGSFVAGRESKRAAVAAAAASIH